MVHVAYDTEISLACSFRNIFQQIGKLTHYINAFEQKQNFAIRVIANDVCVCEPRILKFQITNPGGFN